MFRFGLTAYLVALGSLLVAAEKMPANAKVASLSAFPEKIELTSPFAYRQLVVTGKLESGEVVDLTRTVVVTPGLKTVSVSPEGLVRAVIDGAETLTVTHVDKSVAIPVTVNGAAAEFHPSFVRDVQPALSKMGCNAGTCHGAAAGKNGFKLSLRGYDAEYDFLTLTDELGARRFNRAAPEQSLFLLKATGSIPHVGGVRTSEAHPYYRLVSAWIRDGVKLDKDSPRVARIDLHPQDPILPLPEMRQQMAVLATYTDGSVRDVTAEAFIESGDIEVLEANTAGLITALRRGEAPVLARYEGAYAASTITVMGDRTGFVWQQPETHNYIDELVYKKLQRVKIAPGQLCTDEEFIRRVYLDLTGVPPTVADIRALLADARPTREKREALVDRLVGSRDFVEHWSNKWADLLQVNRKFLGEEGSLALRNWIVQSLSQNKPYDQFAYELLNGSGSTLEHPEAAYYKVLREPEPAAENTTHLFLGVRFNCNKCHDHPFERWTQDQYYQLAAFFSQVGRKEDPAFAGKKIEGSAVEGATPLVEVIFDSGGGEVKHLRTGQVAPPKFPYEIAAAAPATMSRREQLARWITARDNRYFARSYVNRLWGYLLGRGLIEPIDDIRAGNPATNPELLDALTKDFVDHNFDVQYMLRTICKSRTYQHALASNAFNEDDLLNYSHAVPRRLTAEVLYDTLHRALGSSPRLPGVPAGFRAAQIPDSGVREPFLDDFGRPPRESACECERTGGVVLGPVMKLINGPTVASAIGDPGSEFTKLVATQADDNLLVEEVFLRLLARKPTAREVELALDAMKQVTSERDRLAAELAAHEAKLAAAQTEWEKSLQQAAGPVEWKPLELGDFKSTAGATFAKQADGAILVGGTNAKDAYSFTARVAEKNINGFRLEALTDPSLPTQGPGRAPNGNFVLNEFKVTAAPQADAAKAEPVSLRNATADFSQESWNVAGTIDGNEGSGWAVHPQAGKSHHATFESQKTIGHEGGTLLTFTFVQQYTDGLHQLGKFRLAYTTSAPPFAPRTLPEAIATALAVPAEKRSPEQAKALLDHHRALDPRWVELSAAVTTANAQVQNPRLSGMQDLAWALINSPAFLFNR